MTDYSDKEICDALEIIASIDEKRRFKQLCKLNDTQKRQYKELLDDFVRINKISKDFPNAPTNLHNLKGDVLEGLVTYLFQISGGIFKVDRNLHTSTNEIDHIITLTSSGKTLLKHGLINSNLSMFLGECKNYHKSVSVTYVGKFCSLLLTNNIKLGILFSYHGVSGSNWSHGTGLIKKFYLHKEKVDERFCIIDFSINDFNSILDGKNLLQIIEEKIMSLQLDTDYVEYLSRHPAESNSN